MLLGDANLFIVVVMIVSIGLTACYTLRLNFYLMFGGRGGGAGGVLEDGGANIYWPLVSLSLLGVSVGGGFLWFSFPEPGCVCLPLSLRVRGVFFVGAGA